MNHIKTYIESLYESQSDDLLIRAAFNGKILDAKASLNAGANVNARDRYGDAALHMATKFYHPYIIELLLDRGADIEIKNAEGKTPLVLAVERVHTRLAKLLIERGADPFKAFKDPERFITFFRGDIDWLPEGDLKQQIKLAQRSKKMFGV